MEEVGAGVKENTNLFLRNAAIRAQLAPFLVVRDAQADGKMPEDGSHGLETNMPYCELISGHSTNV